MKNGKRELLVGAVGLVKGNVRGDCQVMLDICNHLEPEFESTQFLLNAPFDVVSLIIRYGNEWRADVEIGRINKRNELEVAIELPMSELRTMQPGMLRSIFLSSTLRALLAVGAKYNLPVDRWNAMLISHQPH